MLGRGLLFARLLFGGLLALGGIVLGVISYLTPGRVVGQKGANVVPGDLEIAMIYAVGGIALGILLLAAGVLVMVLTVMRESRPVADPAPMPFREPSATIDSPPGGEESP